MLDVRRELCRDLPVAVVHDKRFVVFVVGVAVAANFAAAVVVEPDNYSTIDAFYLAAVVVGLVIDGNQKKKEQKTNVNVLKVMNPTQISFASSREFDCDVIECNSLGGV